MDLQSLAANIKEYFNPGSSAIYTAPGQSYGPAESRLSRVPIHFNAGGPDNMSGLYTAHGIGNRTIGNPQIDIYPNSQDMQKNFKGNVGGAIKHEIAHSILSPDPKGEDLMEQAATGNPQYESVMKRIAATRAGNMTNEVPATMAEPNPERYGVSANMRAQYISNMLQQLKPNYPKQYDQYQRLIGKQ